MRSGTLTVPLFSSAQTIVLPRPFVAAISTVNRRRASAAVAELSRGVPRACSSSPWSTPIETLETLSSVRYWPQLKDRAGLIIFVHFAYNGQSNFLSSHRRIFRTRTESLCFSSCRTELKAYVSVLVQNFYFYT